MPHIGSLSGSLSCGPESLDVKRSGVFAEVIDSVNAEGERSIGLVGDLSVLDDDVAGDAAELEVFDTVSANGRTVVVLDPSGNRIGMVETEGVLDEERDGSERTPAAEVRTAVFGGEFCLCRLVTGG